MSTYDLNLCTIYVYINEYHVRANGALLGQKRKCRIEYKPDWVVYIKSWTSRLDLAVLELKRPSGSNNGPVSDFVKLGRQMKTMLGKLVDIGVESPVVCGILVEGKECTIL